MVWFGLLGVNASATARVISRRWNDDEISFLVEETGVPGGNHRPTASNWWNFSHVRPAFTNELSLNIMNIPVYFAKERLLLQFRLAVNTTRSVNKTCQWMSPFVLRCYVIGSDRTNQWKAFGKSLECASCLTRVVNYFMSALYLPR